MGSGAIFLNLVPVFTAIIAVPALGERVVPAHLLGGLLVFAGVTICFALPGEQACLSPATRRISAGVDRRRIG